MIPNEIAPAPRIRIATYIIPISSKIEISAALPQIHIDL